MQRILWFLLLLPALQVAAQDSTSKEMEELIIYANKFAENKKFIVQKIDVVTARDIARTNAQNTGDLLINTGNVFVQKSQQGGSSPVIRGFEASRVLIVIDGVRMNNAIYRAGHLQNVITVDQNMLERVEVLYGPASTLYGSDALGGVLLLRTRQPLLSATEKTRYNGTAFMRYTSANQEKTGHADLSIGGKKFAWLQSYTFSDFGDLRMGDNYTSKYPDFGRRSQYITQVNGIDSAVSNEDDRIQKYSGYRQWDIMQKLRFKPSEKWTHTLNLQHSNSSNVPRYDRLQDLRNGRLRWAEWYYGPQQRTLAAFEALTEPGGFLQTARAIVSYQFIEESRNQRAYRNNNRESRIEQIGVWNITVDGKRNVREHEITFGVDAQLNDVRSRAHTENIQTGARGKLDTRYPNGSNHMNYYGVYAQHLKKIKKGKLVLNDGLRFQAVTLLSKIGDNSFFNFPFTTISAKNSALTGNLGMVYQPKEALRFTAGISSGFRTPNVDDASRVVEPPAVGRLTIPNPDIKPEYTYNADLGFNWTPGKLRFELTGYYTLFRNAISLSPFKLNGQDSIDYNGSRVRVFANQNVNRAYLYGVQSSITADLGKWIRLFSTINYTYGRLRPMGAAEVPLDHIPPVFGKSSITYSDKKLNLEFYSLYNAWKRISGYNPNGEDNPQYATADGTPAWFTLNLKGSYELHPRFTLQAGLENLLDRNYRYFASGFSAPGRSLMLALRARL